MTDPYKTLGVSPSATDEEVKEAYRAMAKKYHPDQYSDSPLADLASEKMKEINEAYDTIVSQRKNRSTGGYSAPFVMLLVLAVCALGLNVSIRKP